MSALPAPIWNKQSSVYSPEGVFCGLGWALLEKFALEATASSGSSGPVSAGSRIAFGQAAGLSGLAASITENHALSETGCAAVAQPPSHSCCGSAEFRQKCLPCPHMADLRTQSASSERARPASQLQRRPGGAFPLSGSPRATYAGRARQTSNLRETGHASTPHRPATLAGPVGLWRPRAEQSKTQLGSGVRGDLLRDYAALIARVKAESARVRGVGQFGSHRGLCLSRARTLRREQA